MQYKTDDEIREYFKLLRQGNIEYREKIIINYLDLVYSTLNKMNVSDELFSDGCIGLIKAVDNYDYTMKIKFITYASKCIKNQILMTIRSNTTKIKICSINEIIRESTTIEDTLYDEEYDILDNYLLKEEYNELRQMLSILDERELKIINLYYGFDCQSISQQEIADILNLSKSYISRIIKKSRIKIKNQYKNKILTKHK